MNYTHIQTRKVIEYYGVDQVWNGSYWSRIVKFKHLKKERNLFNGFGYKMRNNNKKKKHTQIN